MKAVIRLIVIASLIISNTANAESNDTYVFVDGGILGSGDFCDTGNSGLVLSSCSKNSTAYRVGFGYARTGGGLGMELSYANLGEFSGDASIFVTGVGTVGINDKVSGTAILLPVTYSFEFGGRSLVAIKFGLAFTQGKGTAKFTSGAGSLNGKTFYDTSASGTAAIYGLGVTGKINDKISTRVQYEIINKLITDDSSSGTVGINNLGLFSFGLSIGF